MYPSLQIATTIITLSVITEIVSSYSFLPTASHRNVLSTQRLPLDVVLCDIPHHPYYRKKTQRKSSQQQQQQHPQQKLTMKVSRGSSKINKGNTLETINRTRKYLAGKPGTKHYMDPGKLFIGNIPYDATIDDLTEFLEEHLTTLHDVASIKIITDWKTGKSKGYGFIQFYEPMSATSAMSIIKGKKLKGRVIRLDQGRKKDDLENRKLFVQKRSRDKTTMDTEEKVIDDALDEVEGIVKETYDSEEEEEDTTYSLDDFSDEDDALFEDEDDDDEEFDYDGIFEQMYPNKWEELDEEEAEKMNREQRREAAKRRPRKKLPFKGFGSD